MEQNLIVTNNSNSNEQENLMREIKKMSYIQLLILFSSLLRFILLFFSIFLLIFFPKSFNPNIFSAIIFLYVLLVTPIFVIYFLIVAITGLINRDFWVKKERKNFSFYLCFCFCCCVMYKNVRYLKVLSLINGIIEFLWSLILLYYFAKDSVYPNNLKYFPYTFRRVLYRIILYFIDSCLLFGLSYFFYYFEYFLGRVEKYLEYYKRLIIKNRNKEAEYVRNALPANLELYISSNGNGEEMKNI